MSYINVTECRQGKLAHTTFVLFMYRKTVVVVTDIAVFANACQTALRLGCVSQVNV